MPRCQGDDQIAVKNGRRGRRHDKGAIWLLREIINRALDVGSGMPPENVIEDFSQSQHDKIAFIGVAGVNSFADLSLLVQAGATLITAGADQVTLNNFTGTLTANDFLFAPA
jgi:hypothetical protein